MNDTLPPGIEQTRTDNTPGTWARLHRLLEAPVLFTGISLLILAVIWGTSINLVNREHAAADRTATALAADLTDTYEAQVIRALREIDNALRLVAYHLEDNTAPQVLEELRARALLPPELLFTVAVTDAAGDIIASTGAVTDNIADQDHFQRARTDDGLVIGHPVRDAESDDWHLSFSRRLETARRQFGGIVSISVSAGYFVSGYEPAMLGREGVLGLVGTDGVFRVRRSGDAIVAGTTTDYDTLVPADSLDETPVTVQANDWDGIRRYTAARQLFEFPLAIVVGLSEAERIAPATELARTYLWRAAVASLLLIAVVALLGRLSWQLQNARRRVMEERVAHARRVEYLAYHDNLTGLPNRAFFSRLLSQGMLHARRYEKQLALLFLDLDRFKAINDSLGHDAGDELLQEIGRRLKDSLRASDVVARLGGDEFVILLPEISDESQVEPTAHKILGAVGRTFSLAGHEFRITVSIGIALFPKDGEDEQTLMKHADIAMYHAKEEGKNNFQFYSERLSSDSLERLALESSLRNALENGEFRLFYQAKRDMITNRVTGMEALLRWDHPHLGLVMPMQFIPLAEENGLIVPIGRWVLHTACQQNVAWQKAGHPKLSIAVNLSARQFFDESLLHDIEDVLHETGMAPELLELEITESMIMRDMEKTIRILNNLKDMGIRIAIDDFGTGYSSLSTLKAFPLDTIKIDSSFIRDIVNSSADRSLTEAVIAMGKSLSLTVVAEGVESEAQVNFLRTHSCNQFQGFYINTPMPAGEFESLLQDQVPVHEP